MKFEAKVRETKTGREWWEDYDYVVYGLRGANQKAKQIVKDFNSCLSENESPREVIAVELGNNNTKSYKDS